MTNDTKPERCLIKLCGATAATDIDIAAQVGADIVGVHLIGPTVTEGMIDQARHLAALAQSRQLMASLVVKDVTTDQVTAFLQQIPANFLQLHQAVSQPEQSSLEAEARRHGTKLVRLVPYEDIAALKALPGGDGLLILDWRRGGTGQFADKKTLSSLDKSHFARRVFIAGGLNADNVRSIIDAYSPFAVDVQTAIRDGQKHFDRNLAAKFCAAARAHGDNTRPAVRRIAPYPRYGSSPWAFLRDSALDANDAVSRLHLLENFEQQAPYSHAEDLLTNRVLTSIDQLARHSAVSQTWLEAAVLAYASTTYFPPRMMRASLRYLYILLERLISKDANPDGTNFHVFTNDPGEITETFFRMNGIKGRLDHEKHARIPGVAELAQNLLDLKHGVVPRREAAKQALRTIAQRSAWVLLADQTLSGHSLERDVQRLLMLQQAFRDRKAVPPRIHVLCQISTATARANLLAVREISEALQNGNLTLSEAIFLDETFNASSDKFNQIDARHVSALRELCKWFAEEYIKDDEELKRMRLRSGDDLAYGYKKAGLLIARQENCPTDSLPLLWYKGRGRTGIEYAGPYPRVHSRIGNQNIEPTQDVWSLINKDKDVLSTFVELRIANPKRSTNAKAKAANRNR